MQLLLGTGHYNSRKKYPKSECIIFLEYDVIISFKLLKSQGKSSRRRPFLNLGRCKNTLKLTLKSSGRRCGLEASDLRQGMLRAVVNSFVRLLVVWKAGNFL